MTGLGSSPGCEGKKSYPSYASAQRSSKRLNKFHESAKSNAYHCTSCKQFHVGNTRGDKDRKRYDRNEVRRELRLGGI